MQKKICCREWKAMRISVDTLWWIITGTCNLSCQHCYIDSPKNKYQQLSFIQCLEVLQQAKQVGIHKIFLTGGEPFIRQDLLEIIQEIYRLKMQVIGIETNATLISLSDIQTISAIDQHIEWHISYDGLNYHDEIRGDKEISKKVVNVITELKQRNFNVAINTTINPANIDTLLPTYEFLCDLQIDSWQIFPLVGIGQCQNMKNYVLSVWTEGEAYVALYHRWLQDKKPFHLFLSGVLTQDNPPRKSKQGAPTYQCEYFRSTITLLPDGVLVPCCRYIAHLELMQQMVSVFQHSMAEQLQDSTLKEIKNIKMQELLEQTCNASCAKCDLLHVCNLGCRINAYLETGYLHHKEPKHCQLMRDYYIQYFEGEK